MTTEARADRRAGMQEDARRREAARAAAVQDQAALRDLTRPWPINYGKKGRSLSPAAALFEAWKQEDLLHPSRVAAARWLRALEAAGTRSATVQVRLSAARSLSAALRSAGATEADPFKDAHEKRGAYSRAEVHRLVLLGAYRGLRAVEMARLRWADVDPEAGRLRLRAARAAGGLPALRHGAGTRLYEQSGDVELASRLRGHASIATPTIYIKRSDATLARALASRGE